MNKEAFDYLIETGLRKLSQQPAGPKITPLAGPQQFPPPRPVTGNMPPIYQHPSGSRQLGALTFGAYRDPAANSPAVSSAISGRPTSPGVDHGPTTFRISQHGGGNQHNYTLSNPDGPVANVGRDSTAGNWILRSQRLPAGTNPSCLITNSCNKDQQGADPSLYARWFGEHIQANEGTNSQLFGPQPKVNLNKVVMQPPGKFGLGTFDTRAAFRGDMSGFAHPYLVENEISMAGSKHVPGIGAPHEYRLSRGADPRKPNSWTDTGIYTDARQTPIPFVGIHGEAKEFGRHTGLSPELGGGGVTSYLDKIRAINDNPDATYAQKVRSNYARPIGSPAALVRDVGSAASGYASERLQSARLDMQRSRATSGRVLKDWRDRMDQMSPEEKQQAVTRLFNRQ